MSKMSMLHAELSEQASDLGFETLGDALANGYEVDYENAKLIGPQEMAHEAWLKERDEVLGDLMNLMTHQAFDHAIIERAYRFIKEQCYD